MCVQQKPDSQRGISIVELLVGLTILAVAIMGFIQVSVSTAQVRNNTRERHAAASAVSEQLRAVENTPFANLVTDHDGRGFGVFIEDEAGEALQAQVGDPDGLPGLIQVSVPSPPDDASLLLEVTVSVSWIGSFAPQAISRRILISRPGASL